MCDWKLLSAEVKDLNIFLYFLVFRFLFFCVEAVFV